MHVRNHAALYLNWCGAMVQLNKKQQTSIFTSPAVLNQRSEWVLAILERMSNDSLNHPALIVLGKDLHMAQQQRKCIRIYCLYRSDSRISLKLTYSFEKSFIFYRKQVYFRQTKSTKTNTSLQVLKNK